MAPLVTQTAIKIYLTVRLLVKRLSAGQTFLLDEDGAATTEPDVEVVPVVRRQTDLRGLDQGHVQSDASADT